MSYRRFLLSAMSMNRIASVSISPKVQVLDVTSRQFGCGAFGGPLNTIRYLEMSDDIIFGCYYGENLKVWRADTGQLLNELSGHISGYFYSFKISGKRIIAGRDDGKLNVWDVNTGKCIQTLHGHKDKVKCISVCNDKIVSGSSDGTLRLWQVENGKCLQTLRFGEAEVSKIHYDDNLIISSCLDEKTVKVWNPEKEECLYTLDGGSRIFQFKFDSVRVVIGSEDGSIRIFDLETGAYLHTLLGHNKPITCLELKNNTLVSGSSDGAIYVWDVARGSCLRTLGKKKALSGVDSLVFNKNFIVTSNFGAEIELWNIQTGNFIKNLTCLEKRGDAYAMKLNGNNLTFVSDFSRMYGKLRILNFVLF